MRRMRRFFAALFVLVLFGTGMVCIPAQGAKVRTVAAETRDPYRPVEVQYYTTQYHIFTTPNITLS